MQEHKGACGAWWPESPQLAPIGPVELTA